MAAKKRKRAKAKKVGGHKKGHAGCKACAKIHSKRKHWSHSKGPNTGHRFNDRARPFGKKRRARKGAKRRARK